MLKKIIMAILAIVVLTFAGTAIWMSTVFPYQESLSEQALVSDEKITVTTDSWIEFAPNGIEPDTGLIFYPGGKTHPNTFAPVMRQIAELGYLSVITPMPLNTAFLGIDKAQDVITAHQEIKKWYIVGHSLGGVGAVEFAKAQASAIEGIILWASYAASDISKLPIKVLSIAADKDKQSTPDKIQQYASLLPEQTQFKQIAGGNHWQFGYYADEQNEQNDLIPRQQQIAQLIKLTNDFVRGLP